MDVVAVAELAVDVYRDLEVVVVAVLVEAVYVVGVTSMTLSVVVSISPSTLII